MIQQTNKYINKALSMEIIKQQINISINKTELNALIAEALSNPDTAATIKRAISPLLADAFPQFPEFTNISIGDTAEDGSTLVILKQPRQTVDTPIKSIEPLVVNPTAAPEYVEPSTDSDTTDVE